MNAEVLLVAPKRSWFHVGLEQREPARRILGHRDVQVDDRFRRLSRLSKLLGKHLLRFPLRRTGNPTLLPRRVPIIDDLPASSFPYTGHGDLSPAQKSSRRATVNRFTLSRNPLTYRPPLPKPEQKRHFVAFKLDDAQFVALERKAKSLRLSKSDAVREAIRRFVESEG